MRNVRPSFAKGLWAGIVYAGIDQYVFRGKAPWTFRVHADHAQLKKACRGAADRLSQAGRRADLRPAVVGVPSDTNHEENQPAHLTLKDPTVPVGVNLALYDAPEQRYCPAGVYEIVRDAQGDNPRLQINAQNCVHCKTCDIKDPTQNIVWVAPEGGGGPNYPNM